MPQPATLLRVPQPCAESWDAMTPTALGRHCAACQKTVIDFTKKTDAEILAYLARADRGRTCGRFRVGQLGRPLRPALPATRWQAWRAGALLATLTLQSCQHSISEPQPIISTPAEQLIGLGDTCVAVMAVDSVEAMGADSSATVLHENVLGEVEELPARP